MCVCVRERERERRRGGRWANPLEGCFSWLNSCDFWNGKKRSFSLLVLGIENHP